jgi:hypothetical protein
VSHGTLPSIGDEGTSDTQVSTPFVAGGFSEPDLVFPVASVCFIPHSWDPMVEEVVLGATVGALGRSCQEEVPDMVGQLANPPPIAMSSSLCNPLHPVEDI